VRNDAYMGEFERAYHELYGQRPHTLLEGAPVKPSLSVAPALAVARFAERRVGAVGRVGRWDHIVGEPLVEAGGGAAEKGGGAAGDTTTGGGSGSASSPRSVLRAARSVTSLSPTGASGGATGGGGASPSPAPPPLAPQWRVGPRNPEGALVDLSDRPLMGLAVDPRCCGTRAEVAVAGSDHAAYVVDLLRGQRRRVLHGGRFGHTEWVTGVTYLGDGSDRVASCGMDGKLCVWAPAAGKGAPGTARCVDFRGHFGSISGVASPGGGTAAGGPPSVRAGHVLVSAGYDKSVKVWDGRSGGGDRPPAADLRGHDAPVLHLALRANDAVGALRALSGDRGGAVRVWDVDAGAAVGALGGHRGHITALAWLCGEGEGGPGGSAGDLALTGAQDGHVRVWDLRAGDGPVANVAAHVARGGTGAVGDICVARPDPSRGGGGGGGGGALGACAAQWQAGGAGGGGEPLIVTAGADKRLCVIDARGGWRIRHELRGHSDFIYSVHCTGGLALSGGGDGLLLAHDVASGEVLWGLGANQAAVRCVATVAAGARQQLVAAGDDGKALVYDFCF
jgi:F-box/WD-40 domain protein 7